MRGMAALLRRPPIALLQPFPSFPIPFIPCSPLQTGDNPCMAEKPANAPKRAPFDGKARSEEHTSELQSLMRISYAVFCLKKKKKNHTHISIYTKQQTTYSQYVKNS